MSVQQALTDAGGFGSSFVYSFASDLVTHEGGASGVNPSAGNDLLIAVRSTAGVTSVDTDQGDIGVEDFDAGGNWYFWRIANISSDVTSVDIVFPSGVSPNVFIIEDDETCTLNFTAVNASDGDGFVTDHGLEYTTDEADELVIASVRSNSGARQYTGANGSNALCIDTTETFAVIYEEVASAETADIEWTINTASNSEGAVVSYQRSGGGPPPDTSTVLPGFKNRNQFRHMIMR